MIKFFKKKPKEKQPPQLMDIDGMPIEAGDQVFSQRYDLGQCTVELEGLEFFYVSQHSEKKVSYVKMIDAITGHQKVKKV
ncbi:hypothetical protein [Ekhidna sp.]|uniref:hypothetical protein n=1 Tax=Ekhidna sp. TaxID=2608089 RepID=UPI003B591645